MNGAKVHMSRFVPAFVLLAVLSFQAFSLQAGPQEKVDLTMMQRIRQEGLETRSRVMEYLSWLTDVYAPRLSESPQYRRAGAWAVKTLTELGLVNAKMEPWGNFGRGWELKKVYAAMTAPQYMPLVAYPKAWTPGTNGLIKGEAFLVSAKNPQELERYKGKLKGAIVLARGEQPVPLKFAPDASRQTDEDLKKIVQAPEPGARPAMADRMSEYMAQMQLAQAVARMAREEGAAAVLEPSRGVDGTLFVDGGGSQMTTSTPPPPTIVVSVEQYNRMVRILKKNLPVSLEIEIQTEFHSDDTTGYNVVAEIPGTDKALKDEIVMLGGHFDTWHGGTGATDDGAGCAVAMEAVRILKALGVQPRRTIRIAFWDAEEQGLIGSREYVKNHFYDRTKKEKKPEYDKMAAYFNYDNGSGKIRGVYAQGNLAVMPVFEEWLKPFHDLGAATVTARTTSGTDHLSFDGVGLPGFQFIQDELEYDTLTHHSTMDVYDHASAGDLMQSATIMAAFVYNAAMRDAKLPRKYFKLN